MPDDRSFLLKQNIARYRRLLTEQLDPVKRKTVERLLSEAEEHLGDEAVRQSFERIRQSRQLLEQDGGKGRPAQILDARRIQKKIC